MATLMRAWTHISRGNPTAVLSLNNIPRPELVPESHVLVKVTHAALSPSTTTMIKALPNPSGERRIPELDFAGVVSVVGEGVRSELQQQGTRVFGLLYPSSQLELLTLRFNKGSLAEYIVAHQDLVALIPENTSLQQAAGLGGAGCTAVRFLEYSKLKQGDRILINGGSGGCGTMLVQIAKHIVGPTGKVVATCSGANVGLTKGLGADEVIDYIAHKPLESHLTMMCRGHKFDVVIDVIGIQALYTRCPAFLAEGRPYLQMGVMPTQAGWSMWSVASLVSSLLQNTIWPKALGGTPRAFALLSTVPNAYLINKVGQYVESGVLEGVVDSVHSMDDAMKAYERLESQRAKGKVIIEVQKL